MTRKLVFAFLLLFSVSGFSQDLKTFIDYAEEKLRQNHWEQASKLFTRIIEKYSDQMTYLQKANAYNHLGYLKQQLLEPYEAESNLSLAILYHEEAGVPNQKDYADALINMGMLYLEEVEFDLARQNITKALGILEKMPEYRADYWIARSKLARVYEEAGSYTLALSIYNEAFDQLVASGNDLSPDFAEICSHRGRILILTGESKEGEEYINLSNTIYESLGKTYDVRRAESMESLAVFYERMGQFNVAERLLLNALQVKRSIPDEAEILIIETLNDLGILYHQTGQREKAKVRFNQVVTECEQNIGTDHPFYATAKNNLGALALAEGNLQAASEMFLDALETYKKRFGEVHPYYANTLNNLARVERKLGNNDLAEKYYKEVLVIDEKIYGKENANYATTLINVAVLYSSTGREVEAGKYYKEAVEIRERVLGKNHPGYESALEYMGMHCLAVGELELAEDYFEKSVNILIGQIKTLFPIISEADRQSFYEKLRTNIDRYNYIANELLSKNPELIKNIFDFEAQTRSALFTTVEKIKARVMDGGDMDLKRAYEGWLKSKRQLASYYQMSVQEREELNINLRMEESRVDREERELTEKVGAIPGTVLSQNQTWQGVKTYAMGNGPVVKIVQIREFSSLTEEVSTLFGFTDRTKYLAIIFDQESQGLEYAYLGTEFEPEEDHFEALRETSDRTEKYEKYWKPLDTKLPQTGVVRIVPDGVFLKVNPNTFQTSGDQYVIDKYFVTYLSSTKDLHQVADEIFNHKGYLFGNPYFEDHDHRLVLHEIQGTDKEIQAVQSILMEKTWNVKTFLDTDANEMRIRTAYKPTVLHIASHTFFEDANQFVQLHSPFYNDQFKSGIFLSGASETFARFVEGIPVIPENDGVLTAYEAMNLDLSKTRLVVLSAGNAAEGSVFNSEGIYGLHRALVTAGVENIISSLERSDSEAVTEFLKIFYGQFSESGKVGASLKDAQLKIREKYPDPRIWGAFILTGNG